MTDTAHLYQTLLGADWDALPAVTRALHAPAPESHRERRATFAAANNGDGGGQSPPRTSGRTSP